MQNMGKTQTHQATVKLAPQTKKQNFNYTPTRKILASVSYVFLLAASWNWVSDGRHHDSFSTYHRFEYNLAEVVRWLRLLFGRLCLSWSLVGIDNISSAFLGTTPRSTLPSFVISTSLCQAFRRQLSCLPDSTL